MKQDDYLIASGHAHFLGYSGQGKALIKSRFGSQPNRNRIRGLPAGKLMRQIKCDS